MKVKCNCDSCKYNYCGDCERKEVVLRKIDEPMAECWNYEGKEKEKDGTQEPKKLREQSIPVSWIENHIEWLKSLDNGFAGLTALNISTMLKKWREENAD